MIGLEDQTFNSLMQYLTTRPYVEVWQLIEEVQKTAQQIQVDAEAAEAPEAPEDE